MVPKSPHSGSASTLAVLSNFYVFVGNIDNLGAKRKKENKQDYIENIRYIWKVGEIGNRDKKE